MAVLKPRTAVVIVLTILAAAVFSLVLLPRWQSTKANSGSQRNDQSSPKSFAESLVTKFDKLEADKEAMWNRNPNPRAGQPETTKSVLSTPMRVNSQKPVSEIHVVGASSSESFQESNGPKPAPQKPPAAGGAEGDDGQRLLRKLKEISEESRPQSPEKLERTPNAVKYERLRSLLGRMHEPANMETPVDLRDEKPRLSTILEKEALERLVKQRNDEEAGARPVRLDADKGQEREIPLRYGIDNRQERERLGISKGQERLRQLKYEGEVHSRNDIMAPDLSPKADNSVNNAMGNFNPSLSDRHNAPTKATMRTSVLTTTSSFLTTVSSTPQPLLNPVKDLPSLKRGSVEIRPERLPPPAHSSDIYYSLLTAPVYHNLRFSLQYLTWLQTVDPKQVNVITDKDDNEWIQAFKREGGNVHLPKCPLSTRKTREMMCCKTGAQFDYWYRAREAGMNYKWYCHFDDDLYMNPQALVDLLSQYDPATDQYLGAWTVVERVHKHNRIPGNMLAPKLHTYAERKRDDFRYANGPSYCISETLMMKVEKYLRGKNFEDNCRKSDAVMDDILPGVIIDGVLGIDLTNIPGFKSQLDYMIDANSQDMRAKAQDIISIGFGRFTITEGRRFNSGVDTKGVLSYHCLLHPEVSWCKR